MAHVWQDRALAQRGLPGGPVAAAPAKARNDVLEGLRFVAALGIVWFHMHAPGSEIAGGALALFLALSTFFAVPSLAKTGPRVFWQVRFQRVLLPWAFWCAFYLAVNAVMLDGLLPALRLENPWALLIGPSIHLWFLPFIFLCGLPICLLGDRVQSRDALVLAAGLGVPFSVAMLWVAEGLTLPPFEQWTVAATPALYGVLAALAMRFAAPAVAPAFVLLTIAGSLLAGATESLLPLAIGVSAFELGRRVAWQAPVLRELGRLSFGIYLVHPFFILVFFKFGGTEGTVASALVVFAASALAAAVMVRLPVLRRFL